MNILRILGLVLIVIGISQHLDAQEVLVNSDHIAQIKSDNTGKRLGLWGITGAAGSNAQNAPALKGIGRNNGCFITTETRHSTTANQKYDYVLRLTSTASGSSKTIMNVTPDGCVAIGEDAVKLRYEERNFSNPLINTSDMKYSLFVQHGILAEKVKVALSNTADWADYVFADDYELMDLEEVEEFVEENNHLPGVPSAEEMVEGGLDVAKMDAKLLEKIEELTLYVIDLQKQIEALKAE